MKIFSTLLILASATVGLASSETDRQAEEIAASSFNFRIALENHVKISVEDGVATLTGKVGLEELKRLADDTVSSIAGVTDVIDLVAVKGEREGSDDWLALKVRSRLLAKRDVSLVDTKVDVKDGVVILSGFAVDEEQKTLTEECTRDVSGVTGVVNQMQVRPGN